MTKSFYNERVKEIKSCSHILLHYLRLLDWNTFIYISIQKLHWQLAILGFLNVVSSTIKNYGQMGTVILDISKLLDQV